jgi:nucleoid DNA-binding protein
MEDHKKVLSTQIPIEVEVEVVKPHFEVDTEARMVDIINMKVKLMKVNEETLEEEEVEEVVEVVVEVIEVNNQIATQIAIIMENLGTWQLLSKGT